MGKYYILRGKRAFMTNDNEAWGRWFSMPEHQAERIVKQETIKGCRVSTVFLGIDHQFGNGRPLLFETIIFGGKHDDYQMRYSTWKQAEAGHQRAVKLVQGRKPTKKGKGKL